MESIITIVGPTASGKTSLAIEVAKRLNGEVISLDSRQIYKGMEIGTAQPTKSETKIINHHLIGFRSPSCTIAAGEYANLVEEKIKAIKRKGKTPILCGGAGLYYRALKDGLFSGSSMNIIIRKKLEKSYDHDPKALFQKLKEIDPEYSKIVHLNNKKRMVRALEIYEITGKAPTIHFKNQKISSEKSLSYFTISLFWERKVLIKRIEERTKRMLKNGWIEEVEKLLKIQKENKENYPALNSIGYLQIKEYLRNKLSFSDMEEKIIIKTRQFARRQSQWFAKEKINLIIENDSVTDIQSFSIIKQLYNTLPV